MTKTRTAALALLLTAAPAFAQKQVEIYNGGGKRHTGKIINGKEEGKHTWWYPNGRKEEQGKYRSGQKEGKWTRWHPDGQKHLIETWEGGQKNGPFVRWDIGTNHSPVSEAYLEKNPGYPGWREERMRDEGTYLNGQIHGSYTGWYANGKKKTQGEYNNGKATGVWKEWYDNGKMRYRYVYHGEMKFTRTEWKYYPSGNLQEEYTYYNDNSLDEPIFKDGVWKEWYENGNMKSEKSFKMRAMEGKWIWWHQNGQVKYEAEYKAGKLVKGSWKEWDESGKLVEQY